MIESHLEGNNYLILELNINFEIGTFKGQNKTFKEMIKDYIETNKLNTVGKKILLSFGGVILATFVYSNTQVLLNDIDKQYTYTSCFSNLNKTPVVQEVIKKLPEESKTEIKKETIKKEAPKKNSSINKSSVKENSTSKKSPTVKSNVSTNTNTSTTTTSSKTSEKQTKNTVTVYRSNGDILNIELEEYVIGVVSAEMPASFNIEALKTQAILARTYALKSTKTNKKLTDTVATQAYIDTKQMRSKWGSEYTKYYNKIKKAVDETKGMYLTYDGKIIDAVYHSISNGNTEDAVEVWGYSIPYLKTVDSSWDRSVSSYKREKEIDSNKIFELFEIDTLEDIKIIERNSSGRVSKIKVGDNSYTGVDFRTLLSLRSTDFDIEITSKGLNIITRGYGHGVGMSQYGANYMANNGNSYTKILNYYYKGVKINKL